MRFLGLNITKAAPLHAVDTRGGWWHSVKESFTGAWQRNVEVNPKAVLAYHAVFSCMTLIASDIAKLRVKLVAQDSNGIWTETTKPEYSVLNKPNDYQTRIQFWESWMLSKLARGNTYVLKQRDNRGKITKLHILDPNRVKPLVTPDGAVYYELSADNIAGIEEDQIVVPAREIIHDRFNCIFHPLVGVSPIYASGLAATQGLAIQGNSANFFGNQSRPGGLLVAPGRIDPDNAATLKAHWDTNFTGDNAGKIAVLGDGLKYENLSVTPEDAQLVEQLRWTAEVVCSTFHVPAFMVGIGDEPSTTGIQDRTLRYYGQCLQSHIMAIQTCLREGLEMESGVGAHFDLDGLLLMDSMTQMEVLEKAKSVLTLDERRKRINVIPITGGNTVYLQQQDHSIEAIAARDALLIDEANNPPAAAPANDDTPTNYQREMAKALLRQRVQERVDA